MEGWSQSPYLLRVIESVILLRCGNNLFWSYGFCILHSMSMETKSEYVSHTDHVNSTPNFETAILEAVKSNGAVEDTSSLRLKVQ